MGAALLAGVGEAASAARRAARHAPACSSAWAARRGERPWPQRRRLAFLHHRVAAVPELRPEQPHVGRPEEGQAGKACEEQCGGEGGRGGGLVGGEASCAAGGDRAAGAMPRAAHPLSSAAGVLISLGDDAGALHREDLAVHALHSGLLRHRGIHGWRALCWYRRAGWPKCCSALGVQLGGGWRQTSSSDCEIEFALVPGCARARGGPATGAGVVGSSYGAQGIRGVGNKRA
jgi:hypothetical protein